MEKKSSRGIPASSFLVASSPPLALVSSCNEERTREGEDGGGRKRRRRAGLASWATRAFLNCIPACVATSRFTHASTHIYATYVHTYMRTYKGGLEPGADFWVGVHRARLLVNILANISLLLLSLSCSVPPLTSPCLAPLLPFTVLFFLFSRRHVRETALWTEPISRRLTRVNSETLLSGKIRNATKMSPRPVLGRFCKNSIVVASRESCQAAREATHICLFGKCI